LRLRRFREPESETDYEEKQMSDITMKKIIHVEGMMCKHCQKAVNNALQAVDGVEAVDVSLDEKCAVVTLTKEVSDQSLKVQLKLRTLQSPALRLRKITFGDFY
jgi:copper chaperone CopZ